MVTHELAVLCGLDVPAAKLESFSDNGGTFLVKRFDREGEKRIHYSSAMTLLGKADGDESTGYPDIAEFIRQNGASPKKDLAELFCRIAFSISVSNTDDHLRNHGFLLCKNGWRLSPMFDVNPNPHGDYLHLSIEGHDNSKDYDLLVKTAKYYGLGDKEAWEKVNAIKETVSGHWRKLAEKYRIGRSEIERMAPALTAADTPSKAV
jgi:serine/threonine-protein kinase HipA